MKLLGPKEVAFRLCVSTRTLEDWRRFHKGPPFVRLEGKIRYNSDDLEKYILDKTVTPEANQYCLPFRAMIEAELARRSAARKTASANCGVTPLHQTPLFATKAG